MTSPPQLADLPAGFWDEAVLIDPVATPLISPRVGR
jgi:hypothetical protein